MSAPPTPPPRPPPGGGKFPQVAEASALLLKLRSEEQALHAQMARFKAAHADPRYRAAMIIPHNPLHRSSRCCYTVFLILHRVCSLSGVWSATEFLSILQAATAKDVTCSSWMLSTKPRAPRATSFIAAQRMRMALCGVAPAGQFVPPSILLVTLMNSCGCGSRRRPSLESGRRSALLFSPVG
jgi:hypothetical protein